MARKEKPDLIKHTPSRQTRPTIGLLCDMTYNEYNLNMWRGVYDAARAAEVNLVYFPGGIKDTPDESTHPARVIYDLVSAEALAGLVIWGAQLGQQIGPQKIQEFCQHYALPVVNIGLPLAGIPSLLVDNCQGMQDVVTHLIEAHNCRRIAFLGGQSNNSEAQERYRGYTQALVAHGLPLEAALVVGVDEADTYNRRQWDPLYNTRLDAINFLLDERQLRPQRDFDAIVGYDDNHSIGVIEELQRRGWRVPYDVAVASFDNIEEAGYVTPPLTTANQSFYELGARATDMLLSILRGETTPELVVLPMEVMIRQSCGCADPVVKQAISSPVEFYPDDSPTPISTEQRAQLLAEIKLAVGLESDCEWAGQLLDAFWVELTQGKEGIFSVTLDSVLRQMMAAGKDVAAWQGGLSALRRYIAPALGEANLLVRAEDLWLQARVMISELGRRAQVYRAFQYDRQAIVSSEIGQKFITTFNINQLMDVLAENLPRLDIASAYLSLYNNPTAPVEEARLILAYNEHGRVKIEGEGQNFPSRQLAPAGLLPPERPYSFIVEPLYFQQNQLGFALLEINPHQITVYHTMLRGQISSALQGALLVEKRLQAEQALRAKAEEQAVLLDNIETHIFYLSDPGIYGAVNKAHAEFLGLQKQDLEYKSLVEILGPEMAEICIAANKTIFDNKQQLITEEWMTTTGGENRLFSFVKTPKLDAQGNVEYIICVGEDITERQRAEQALRASEAELRSLFAAMTDVVLVLDAGGRYLKIAPTNPSLLYRPSVELLGKTLHEALPSQVADTYLGYIQRVLETGQPINIEYDLPVGQEMVWFAATISPLPGNQVFWIARDITERKQAEAALSKRAAELEIVAQVSTAALNILDTTELLQKVVNLTKESFDLYHAHIYLFDEISNALVLAAGAGAVGQHMVADRWSIAVEHGHSLVASAFHTRQGVTVNDVRANPDWLPNPLLPDTRAELAVPLLAGERVLGVLDVQSNQVGHFTVDDIRIQTILAAQIAVALENARLFEQSQKTDMLLRERVKELDCLNDIGREMEENPPPLPELLQWITERIPAAMYYPELSVAAIEFDGQVYGRPEAIQLPNQITHGLYIGGQLQGRIYIAHTERRDFIDEESALLGGIATRVSGFIENQRLFEQTRQRATALEEATNFLDSIVENIPVMLFVKDAENLRFIRWNKAGEELLGFNREDMIGKTDYDFFPKDEADFFVNKDRDVFKGRQLVEIPQESIQTSHKGIRLLHTRKFPIYSPDGQPRYLLGISEDITERKQTEEERERLLVEVRRLAAIVENHPDFIGVGTMPGQILYVNPSGLKMMGLPPDYNLSAVKINDFYPPEDADRLLREGVPQALAQGYWSTEANLRQADGTIVPVEETVSIILDTEGQPSTFSVTMHDITNRKVAAAEQSRLLAEVEAAYRQFVRREWEKYLIEQHQGQWHIEHQLAGSSIPEAEVWLAQAQAQVRQEGKTKITSGVPASDETPMQDKAAAIVAPIALRGQVIGTLNLQDVSNNRVWTAEEIALVEAVSEQLALTVENLRLFDDTQRRATREQLTRQITDKLHAAPDVDSIIQTGLTELAKSLGVSRAYVKLSSRTEQDK